VPAPGVGTQPSGRRALILGCGFTGRRVAERLLARGVAVIATTRDPARLGRLARLGVDVQRLDALDPDDIARLPSCRIVLHSIPVIGGRDGWLDATPALMAAAAPRRVVYLSSTGVYGSAKQVDETTPAAPGGQRARLRVQAEEAVAGGGWSWMILRAAAIYGPGRGVHEAMRAGTHRLVGDGGNYVSRIQVDDLAAITEAALLSDLTGAWPVADEQPCRAREIAEFCAGLLGVPMPPALERPEAGDTRSSDRIVDGSAIRRALGVTLRYPSYRTGVPACVSAAALP